MQPYCFRFYFRFVTVFILAQMVQTISNVILFFFFEFTRPYDGVVWSLTEVPDNHA